MTQPQQPPHTATVDAPAGHARAEAVAAPFPRLLVVPLALVVGAAVVYVFGLDALWPMITGGVIAAVLAYGADVLINRTGVRQARVLQVVAVLAIAGAVAAAYRADRTSAFRTVFGVAPPPGVRQVDIERYRASDTGRKLTILQFRADRAAVDGLVGPRQFAAREVEIRPGREPKAQRGTWGSAFSTYGLTVVDRWKNRLPVTEPFIYRWTATDRDHLGQQATLLWDAESGRGYAVHAGPTPAPGAPAP